MRTILILVMALALVAPVTADAGFRKRVQRAQTIAAEYWGASPAHCPTVRTRQIDTLMNDGAAAEAGYYSCAIYFKRGWWALRRYYFPKFCSVYVHEWGHLLGLDHSDNPDAVMYPEPPALKACA